MVTLIPSPEKVMEMFKEYWRFFREGHFVYPSGKHAAHYFQMPLAFPLLRHGAGVGRSIESIVPHRPRCCQPSAKGRDHQSQPGGIPVAFRRPRSAQCAADLLGRSRRRKRMFRQYVGQGEVNPCIIIDDIIRSGRALTETVELVKELGTPIIGIGTIVHFNSALDQIAGIPIKMPGRFRIEAVRHLGRMRGGRARRE